MILSSPAKKVVAIFVLFFLCLLISLPADIPLKIHIGNFNYEANFKRPNLNFSAGKLKINKNFDLILGLDLAGGSHLVFEADTNKVAKEKRKTSLEALRNVIERRVNLFGIAEPNVQISNFEGKDRAIVELPGIKDTQQAVNLIGATAQLVFARMQLPERGDGKQAEVTATGSAALMPTNLTGADLADSSVSFDRSTGKPSVSLSFTSEGGEKFAKITEENIGKPVAILLDEEIISAPVVQEKIIGGQAQITGNFTLDEVKKLSIQLNAGALPVPVKLVEERTVGATLGAESISRSVIAGFVGLLMVMAFMILSYGKLGLVADIGLMIFGVLTLALYKLIPVVLTLPGIAGFLLSVGMAVDSNILIFERFKEEKTKRPYAEALEISFGRAWDSIRDANIATLFTAFILANPLDWSFLHTSGPVRGFAITLALGIGISLFTGIYVSRNLLRVFITEGKRQEVKGKRI